MSSRGKKSGASASGDPAAAAAGELRLPVARIKRVMKLDTEVHHMSKECGILMTHAVVRTRALALSCALCHWPGVQLPFSSARQRS